MAIVYRPTAASLLLVLLAVALAAPAAASTLTVFSGPGCSGKSKDINGCGCFDLSGYRGGYHFVYTEEQPAILNWNPDCSNVKYPGFLDRETRNCQKFPFKSVEMLC